MMVGVTCNWDWFVRPRMVIVLIDGWCSQQQFQSSPSYSRLPGPSRSGVELAGIGHIGKNSRHVLFLHTCTHASSSCTPFARLKVSAFIFGNPLPQRHRHRRGDYPGNESAAGAGVVFPRVEGEGGRGRYGGRRLGRVERTFAGCCHRG